MTVEVKVPMLPESVEDAVVASWHKQPGDKVNRDENLVDLETDKVVLEVPAPVDGTLIEIKAEAGATVTAGQLLAIIEAGEAREAAGEPTEETPTTRGERTKQAETQTASAENARSSPGASQGETPVQPGPARDDAGSDHLSPSVRRLVAEQHLDPTTIPGTGRGGRITKSDIVQFMKADNAARPEERVKMTRIRSRIAQRMKDAQNTAAILTTFNEVDLKAVLDLRRRYGEAFQDKYGVKLGLMSFFVRACVDALRKYPVVNASLEGDEIIYHGYQDIGIAVSTERGLMVPVMRNAQYLGLAEIELAISQLAEKARAGTIALEDLQGGTFTITNGGVFGSLLSTPLLNPPQSGILGMHSIQERAVVIADEVVARPMMYIALSYDHRLVDGKDAVQFLVAVKNALEDPARLLLSI